MPHAPESPDDERRLLLGAFLQRHRAQIDPLLPILGSYTRRAQNIGKPVEADEIADAIGASRRSYKLAEGGEATRFSSRVLLALESVFALSAAENAILANLTLAHSHGVAPREQSLETLKAFGSLRRYMQKLTASSSTQETLNVLQDTAASFFPEVACIDIVWRRPGGGWSFHGDPVGPADRTGAFVNHREEVLVPIFALQPHGADVVTGFPQFCMPGELLTYHHYADEAELARLLGKSYRSFQLLHAPMLAGIIRSRDGFVGQLYLGGFRATYDTEDDSAIVQALVDFASFAALAPSPAIPQRSPRMGGS